jgi:flagellar basal body-associated protein FliL
MSRNEIRLRRKMMTSRRIERHKNYQDIMKRHERQVQLRKVLRIFLVLLLLLALTGMVYWLMSNPRPKSQPHREESVLLIESEVPQVYVTPKQISKWNLEKTRNQT